MCLIVFSWQPDSKYPLVLAANRDEYYQRPTLDVSRWQDDPDIFGGRDLEAGGSWLAVNRNGRFAAVTNYREVPVNNENRSRGELVSGFLTSRLSAREYLTSVSEQSSQWSGFNLLIADHSGLYYFSNRAPEKTIKPLQPGIYGLSNHLLDTPWPKLQQTRNGFADIITASPNPDQLIQLMKDDKRSPVEQLPDTGGGLEFEKLVSSCFIASDNYGTRNTSVLIFDQVETLHWTEQSYLPNGVPGERQFFSLPMPLLVNPFLY
ncbi:MAG: NRDE family protein [Endozoicomonas sp.]